MFDYEIIVQLSLIFVVITIILYTVFVIFSRYKIKGETDIEKIVAEAKSRAEEIKEYSVRAEIDESEPHVLLGFIPRWGLVEDLIKNYHRQAQRQATVQFWLSATVAGLGAILIAYIIIKSISSNNPALMLNSAPGVLTEAIAILFFKGAYDASKRATAFFDRLRTDNNRVTAIRILESLDDPELRAVAKAQLALYLAEYSTEPLDLNSYLNRTVSK